MIRRRRARVLATDPFVPVNPTVPRTQATVVVPRENPEKVRSRAERRLKFTTVCFVLGFAVIGLKMGTIAATDAREPATGGLAGADIVSARADITDREGRVLATNVTATGLPFSYFSVTCDLASGSNSGRSPVLRRRAISLRIWCE